MSHQPTKVIVAPSLDGVGTYFRHIAACLPKQISIMHLDASGLYGECVPLTCIESIGRRLIEQIGEQEEPLTLVGWSFASMVAFHMAWLLESIVRVRLIGIDPLWAMFPQIAEFESDDRDCGGPAKYPGLHMPFPNRLLIQANLLAQRRYRPRRLNCCATFLIASEHPDNVEKLVEKLHTDATSVCTKRITGDHRSILIGEGAAQIAREIENGALRS